MRPMNKWRRQQPAHILKHCVFRAKLSDQVYEMQKDISAFIIEPKPSPCRRKRLTRRPTNDAEKLFSIDVQIAAEKVRIQLSDITWIYGGLSLLTKRRCQVKLDGVASDWVNLVYRKALITSPFKAKIKAESAGEKRQIAV
jgi:hypothetical protein